MALSVTPPTEDEWAKVDGEVDAGGAVVCVWGCLGLDCDTIDTGVHLTQLIAESVKASIRVHKLCHDGLKCHSTHWRRRSKGGWRGRRWSSCRLCLGLPRSQLCYAPWNSSCSYGTHIREVGRHRIEDGKMTKESRDNGRKNELITSRRVLINIYKREYKVWSKVNKEILNKGLQKPSMRLYDSVIGRQRMKNECHHQVKDSRTFSKGRAWGVLTITPWRRCLTK